MTFEEASIRALGLGYSVFPVLVFCQKDEHGKTKRQKVPLVSRWQEFAFKKPTEAQLKAWYSSPLISRFASIGVPTGNGWIAIDFDSSIPCEAGKLASLFPWFDPMQASAWVQTASGGLHFYYKGDGINATNLFHNNDTSPDAVRVDVRGDGGFVVGHGAILWDKDPRVLGGEKPRLVAEYKGTETHVDDLPLLPEGFTRAREAMTAPSGSKLPAYTAIGVDNQIPRGAGKRHEVALSSSMKYASMAKSPDMFPVMREVFFLTLQNMFEDTNPNDPEYVSMWESAERKVREQRGVYWSRIDPLVKESIGKIENTRELGKWQFQVQSASRLNELLKLKIFFPSSSRARYMTIEVKDLYNQSKFLEAFTVGTNVLLERIKNKAYQEFLQQLNMVEAENTGTTSTEIVADVINQVSSRLSSSDTEEDAMQSVKTRGYGKYGGHLYFRIQRLRGELEIKGMKPSMVATILNELGAEIYQKSHYKIKHNDE